MLWVIQLVTWIMHDRPHEFRHRDVQLGAQVQQVDWGRHPFGVGVGQNLMGSSVNFNIASFTVKLD